MKKIIITLGAILINWVISAQTYVPPGTIDGETWVLDGSPYILTGDVFVTSVKSTFN